MPFKDIERKREYNREWVKNNSEKIKLSREKSNHKKKIEFLDFLKTIKGQLYLLEQEKSHISQVYFCIFLWLLKLLKVAII